MELRQARLHQALLHAQRALTTLTEYLIDYASPETRRVGEALVRRTLAEMDEKQRRIAEGLIRRIEAGERDIYV